MRILQIAPYFHPHVGGVESHVRDIAVELHGRGHHVDILTAKYEKDLADEEDYHGMRLIRAKALFTAFSTPMAPTISKLTGEKYDIIHAHSPPPITEFFAVRGARHIKVPLALTHHCDLEIPMIIGPAVTGAYRRTFGDYALTRADKVIVTTKSYHATSRHVWKIDPVVIPNTVDVKRFNPRNDGARIRRERGLEDKHVCMYVGRLVFHKGLEFFIQSAKFTGDDVVHLIVGTGDKSDELKKMARKHGVQDKVVFTGYVPDEDLPDTYAAIDTLVLPSVSRLEAFGIVGLEAMATGKPVVLSNIPGVRDVITHGVEGYLADPLDAEDIARKINAIMDDPGEASEMGRRGRAKVVEQFSLKGVGDMLLKLYREMIREYRSKGRI